MVSQPAKSSSRPRRKVRRKRTSPLRARHRIRSPIRWFGGKGHVAARLVKLLPPHKAYVEPFGGGASVLLSKPPSRIETYNDLNAALYDFFTTMADPIAFTKFKRRIEALPISREIFDECLTTWHLQSDKEERVWRWFYIARHSFAGRFGAGLNTTVNLASRGIAETTAWWMSVIDGLPEIHARLRMVQIECQDFRAILERYCGFGYLAYCDPPYVPSARRGQGPGCGYEHEMTESDHKDLVKLLLAYEGSVVLSGYNSPIYAPLNEPPWERFEFEVVCQAAGRTMCTNIKGKGAARRLQPRTEIVWRKVSPEARERMT